MDEAVEELRQKALEVTRKWYERAALMKDADLRVIHQRERDLPGYFRSNDELVSHFLDLAGAVSTFAVEIGLITPDQVGNVMVDFYAAHPEMRENEPEE